MPHAPLVDGHPLVQTAFVVFFKPGQVGVVGHKVAHPPPGQLEIVLIGHFGLVFLPAVVLDEAGAEHELRRHELVGLAAQKRQQIFPLCHTRPSPFLSLV